jgi:DNA-directed RNA polymerase specialized sigma24 family protein
MRRLDADAHATVLYRQLTMTVLSAVKATEAEALADVFGEGLEYHELAAKVAKPVGTVKAIVSRARRRIREAKELRHVADVLAA